MIRNSAIYRMVCRRLAGAEQEGGFALMLAILLILIVAALSITMAGLMYAEVTPTGFVRKDIRTVNAANAGLNVVLNQIRAANDGSGNGVLQNVPCQGSTAATFTWDGSTSFTAPGAKFSGNVGDSPGGLTYSVYAAYFTSDPSYYEPGGQNNSTGPLSTQIANFKTWIQANALSCPLGTGGVIPSYAYVESTGAGSAVGNQAATDANRTQNAVYKFATTAEQIVGGRIIEYGTSSPGLCLDAGTATPTAGTQLHLMNCQALGTAQQLFQYDQDLTIVYTGQTSPRLCVTNPGSGNVPTLQNCVTSGSGTTYPYATGQQAQEWGFNDNGHFSAANSDGTVTNSTGGTCLEPQGATSSTPATNGALLITTSCDAATTGYTAWNPDPSVGAGKAGGNTTGQPGLPTYQFVNYKEFGRCLDVTGQSVSATHLIDYPCKQAPDSTKLTWNQLWHFNQVSGSYGQFYTTYSGTNYCLTAPSTTASNNWVVVSPCQSAYPTNQLWYPTGDLPGNYTGSYLLKNKYDGLCMAADTDQQPTYGSSTIVMTACDGSGLAAESPPVSSLALKWNAPPNVPNPGLGDIQETGGVHVGS